MGCDTKGYIKGASLTDLISGLNAVIGMIKGPYWNAKCEIPTYVSDASYAFYSFDYDPNAQSEGFRVTLTEGNEHRRMYAGVNKIPDPSAEYVNPADVEDYGVLSFSDWGHSRELMRIILTHFKGLGYQVYIMENDCAWDTAQEL